MFNLNKLGLKSLNLILFLFIFIFMFSLAYAAPAPHIQDTIIERGVDIVHPETLSVKDGVDIEFNFWTYNSSDGRTLTNASLNCTVYIIDNTGNQYFRFSNQPGASGLMVYGKGAPLCINCWTMTLPSQNVSVGSYSYQIKCQGSGVGGYYTGFFDVVASYENNTLFFLILIIFAIVLLLIAYILNNHIIAFFSGLMFSIAGIYVMIYGYGDVTNLYTRMIALVTIGIGMIITVTSGFDLIGSFDNGERDDDD